MNVEDLVTERYMWIDYEENFLIRVLFSCVINERSYFAECVVTYEPEKNSWNYQFNWNKNISFPEEKTEEMRQRVEEFIERALWKAEERAEIIFSKTKFTRDYEITPEGRIYSGREVQVKNVTIAGRKVDFTWYVFDTKKVEITFLDEEADKELFKDINFVFTMDFAEKHLKGFKELKDYLLTESKDRLLFLF